MTTFLYLLATFVYYLCIICVFVCFAFVYVVLRIAALCCGLLAFSRTYVICVFTHFTTFVLLQGNLSLLGKRLARQSLLSLQTAERAAAQNLSKLQTRGEPACPDSSPCSSLTYLLIPALGGCDAMCDCMLSTTGPCIPAGFGAGCRLTWSDDDGRATDYSAKKGSCESTKTSDPLLHNPM